MSERPKSRQRLLASDGLRAVTVMIGVIYHLCGNQHIPGAFAAIAIFFVLSGFLITSLLIGEHRTRGSIDLRAFWMRRVVRLGPALGVSILVAVILAVAGVVTAQPHETLVGLPFVLLYAGNYLRAFNQNALGVLGQTWSLAIQEQFYLLWPLVLIWILRRRPRYVWQIILVLAVLDGVWGHVETVAISEARGNFSTDTDAYSLMVGCALALWYAGRDGAEERGPLPGVWRRVLQAATLLAVGVAAVVMVVPETTYSMTPEIGTYTVCIAIVLCQFLLAPGGPFQRLLESAPVRWIGRRSYGIYLYHYPIVELWTPSVHGLALFGIDVVKVALSILAAALSWHYLEVPIQHRFRPRWQRRTAAIRLAALSSA